MEIESTPNRSVVFIQSVALQLIAVPVIYGIFDILIQLIQVGDVNLEFRFFTLPYVNYVTFFGIILVTSIQETTKSELLATTMNVAWIVFLLTEVNDTLLSATPQLIAFTYAIAATIPIRILFMAKHSN